MDQHQLRLHLGEGNRTRATASGNSQDTGASRAHGAVASAAGRGVAPMLKADREEWAGEGMKRDSRGLRVLSAVMPALGRTGNLTAPVASGDEAPLRLLLESVAEGILGLDLDGRCTFANRAAANLLDLAGESLTGHSLDDLLRSRRTQCTPVGQAGKLAKALIRGRPCRFVETLRFAEGQLRMIEFSAAPMLRPAGIAGVVVLLRDVSEAEALTRRLTYEASHDALTGLFNRAEFERRLARTVASERHGNTEHTLCFLDLDRFKLINDLCGHAAGDRVLKTLAEILSARLRKGDILARLGGDEFGLLLENCGPAQATAIAEQLRDAAGAYRLNWEGEEYSVGLSIGLVAFRTEPGQSPAAVLEAADAACYLAKREGRNRIHGAAPASPPATSIPPREDPPEGRASR